MFLPFAETKPVSRNSSNRFKKASTSALPKEQLLKRRVPEILVDQAERKLVKNLVESQPKIQSREMTLIRKDGTSIVCLNTATAVRDNTGRVVRYQGALMDITERREMERRLHQQQEFARRLVDNFPDLILVLDTAAHY